MFTSLVGYQDTGAKSTLRLELDPGLLRSLIVTLKANERLAPDGPVLALELLSLYMVRDVNGSTLISYHPSSASLLHDRILSAGRGGYWEKIMSRSIDPTEDKVITRPDLTSTKAIHIIRARQLRYSSLLEDLKNTIMFIRGKPNPALELASE
ncbi:hypothetical protein H0H93_015634, partial [Arthromyces matolae]